MVSKQKIITIVQIVPESVISAWKQGLVLYSLLPKTGTKLGVLLFINGWYILQKRETHLTRGGAATIALAGADVGLQLTTIK
jgi:hypothetical protein